jgi:hypothetical protein
MKIGTRVRFTRDNLGASRRDDLCHIVAAEAFGQGDAGTVAFMHPNQKPSPRGCKGWFYVEVESKTEPGVKLYVGVHPAMVEAVRP